MRGITGTGVGLAEDWGLLDVAEAGSEGDDDMNFERWLASVTPQEFEQTLNGLIDEPSARFFEQTA
jgi:hypothetical protein